MAATLPISFAAEEGVSQTSRRAYSLGSDCTSLDEIAQEILQRGCSVHYTIRLSEDRLIVNRCGDGVYFAVGIKEPLFPVLHKPHLTVCRKACYSGPDAWSQFHRTVLSLKRLLNVGCVEECCFYPAGSLMMVCANTCLFELMEELKEAVASRASSAEFPAGGWHVTWNIAL